MNTFTSHMGTVAVMDRSYVDTDQIIPKQFLKRIERTGYGQFLFFDWRFHDDGTPNEQFELNFEKNAEATILVARQNFGCGSSREHAVWSLADYGFRCVIAESFADIFYNNCFKNGVLPVTLESDAIQKIMEEHHSADRYQLTVDLEKQIVCDENRVNFSFDIPEFRRQNLLHGLDDIDLTLKHIDKIAQFERSREMRPVANG